MRCCSPTMLRSSRWRGSTSTALAGCCPLSIGSLLLSPQHVSVTSHTHRFHNRSAPRVPLSSSSRTWLLTAAVCVSTASACLYSTLVSCDAAAVAVEAAPTSGADPSRRTCASLPSQSLSPGPQLTGSNELDWQLVRQLQFLLAQPDVSLTPDEQHYLLTRMSDPCTCFRYLLSRSADVQRAAQAIKHTTRWRLANHVDDLTAASLVDKLTDSAMWVSEGTARDGTPLIINKKSTKAETDHERQFQLIVYTLERALRILASRTASLPPPTPPTPADPHPVPLSVASNERWSWFLDLAAFSSGSSTPLKETRRIVDTLMNQYVERLSCVIILDAPQYFLWLWRVVSVVVPAKTKAKVVFLYDLNKEETRWKLQQYVDLNELEQPYGLRERMTLERYLATEPPLNGMVKVSAAQ